MAYKGRARVHILGVPMRFLPLFLFALVAVAPTSWAQDKALNDFFGEWLGSGLAKEGGSTTQNRDTNVTIEKSGDGFKITWSTMRTQIEDQASSVVKSTTLKFKGTPDAKVFHATDASDPLKGGRTAWAMLSGATLRIQLFVVEANGDWNLQIYDRTLTAADAMDVKFKRLTNGEVARQAELKLTKAK